MTLLHEALESKKFDTRVVERHLSRGMLSHEDFEKSVKKLPDDNANAEWIRIDSLANSEAGSRHASNGSVDS